MPGPRIRVLLIEASPLALKTLQTMLASSTEIEVVGAVSLTRSGLAKVIQLRPDVLCLSTQLGGVASLEFVREVMSKHPCPILILHGKGEVVADLLAAGAVDAWAKPASPWTATAALSADFTAKVKRVANIPIISRSRARETSEKSPLVLTTPRRALHTSAAPPPLPTPRSVGHVPLFPTALTAPIAPLLIPASRVVAVGASTGGPQALVTLFSALPRDFPLPILCVQHISKGFLKELVDWMDTSCRLKVKSGASGEVPEPGVVYFSEEDRHLELDARGRLWFSAAPPVDGHRPSVTMLFQSVARTRGKNAIAVLLTGMGSDGARGMQAVVEAGGTTFAQEETSCVVFGMPREAIALGAAQHIMRPADIARKLLALTGQPN